VGKDDHLLIDAAIDALSPSGGRVHLGATVVTVAA